MTARMDYDSWRLFIDAIELGSLSKVAVAYGTSQPHVSRQIGELERECGGRLFQRTGRGVVLTDLGQRVAPKVRAWLASTDQLANDIHTTAGKPIGRVRLGILPSAGHPLVTTLCRRLHELYPLVHLTVREGQGAAETHLSKLTSNRYFVYYANPGAHHYWAKNLTKDDINLEIEAGETYFVKCEIAIGLMSSGPDLSPSDAVEFERYKAKLKPMDAPAPDQADKAAH